MTDQSPPSSSPSPDAAWRRTILAPDATIQQAIRCLSDSGLLIAIVTTDQDVLVGTLTDGDIRRALLRGLDMASPIESVIKREPLVAPPQLGRDDVLRLMQANTIQQLPIVDDRRRVIGLHVWNELMQPAHRPSLMVIMAGGRGERLRPHTETCPKPLLNVGGKPMLEHIIERARSEGFRRFALAVHYLGHMIEEYFGDGSRWQVDIEYLREETPLSTAGALGLLRERPTAPVLVTNADVITDIRYGELLAFHARHRAQATMAVRLHEWQHPFGVVHTTGVDIAGFEEKPVAKTYINAGIYALEPSALDLLIPGQPCDMPTLFGRVKDHGARTIVFPMHEPWIDAGDVEDLQRARSEHQRRAAAE